MSIFEVEAIGVGGRVAESSVFYHLTDAGRELEIVYRLWLLRGDDGLAVVDTGPPLDEAHQRGIDRVGDITDALRPAGIDPADVSLVYLTHLHWDHAANAAQFPNAIFFAQKSEIEFFRSPMRAHPTFDRYYSHQQYLSDLIDAGRIKALDGDVPVDKGLDVIRVGGHTPGSQMLIVDTAAGKVVLSGDAIPTNRNFTDDIPSGIVVDLREAVAALARVRELAPAALYTGHDPLDRLALDPPGAAS
jgi:glyoxylase-like metal-dependent hydrolase (beta-lactamase superfamily II)